MGYKFSRATFDAIEKLHVPELHHSHNFNFKLHNFSMVFIVVDVIVGFEQIP